MAGIALKLEGLKGLQLHVDRSVKEAKDGTYKALVTWAKNVETQSKKDAPSNKGRLRNAIDGSASRDLMAQVVIAVNYVAYLVFGTRKFAARYVATLPTEWKAYAATFRGKGGGTFDQFIQDIMEWVRDKGIGGLQTKSGNLSTSKSSLDAMQQAAYAIALNILQNGIRPNTFFIDAIRDHTPKLEADIKKAFTG